ncbi:hypothetical protein MNBD_IGNAVI01-836 [hydrothermal vent metagenome]|uniref:Lipid/polyisoprenoid-binding YceI-like domain-containing protein n=1 Tax=hydrothermal vent metagenome TaxID=652676 RepID=A0A3B1CSY6_9ZZZZ
MKKYKTTMILLLGLSLSLFAQGFKTSITGVQTFNFADKMGRNQATFYSETPIEDINGTASGLSGTATLDVSDFSTLKGKIEVTVESFKTGIEMRDGHVQGKKWLNAKQFPVVSFEIKKVSDIKQVSDTKLTAKVTGDFTLHGVTKEVTADVKAQLLEESEMTKPRMKGDLLSVRASFNIKLSDFGIENNIIGKKVADDIEVGLNMVGTNKK